jgi:hypothetical protein
VKDKKELPHSSELTHLQKSIRKMDAASPKIILERLKEEWMGVADASIYRELELEKQLWMLAALRALYADDTSASPDEPSSLASRKVLSLFENKGKSTKRLSHSLCLQCFQHHHHFFQPQIQAWKFIISPPHHCSQSITRTFVL